MTNAPFDAPASRAPQESSPEHGSTRVSVDGAMPETVAGGAPTQRVKVQGSGHNWWYDPSAANDMWAVLSRVHK